MDHNATTVDAASRARAAEKDRLLIQGFLSGDKAAVAVVDGWVEVVLRAEFHSLQSEWEDLRQDIRVRLLRNLRAARFNGHSELRTYLHRIAKNAGIDFLRKATRRPGRIVREPDSVTGAAPSSDAQAGLISRDLLGKVLAGLSSKDRHLLDLIHGQHLSYSEIALQLGIAEGTVKARVSRCRERLLALRRQLLEVRES